MPQNLTPGKITGRQQKAVAALLATGEVSAAAREVGISRETLHRWLRDPVFLAAVRAAEAEALDELSRLLVRLGRTAVATIAKATGATGSAGAGPGGSRRDRGEWPMRGRASVIARAGRLEAEMARRRRPRRPRYDLSAFTDDELEAMAALAERIEATGRIPAWTPAEQAVLARLEPKLSTGVRRTA